MRQRENQETELRANGTLRVRSVNKEPTRTQEQYQKQTDVNEIMKKYTKTGELLHLNRKQGVYANLVGAPDYQTALNTIKTASMAFDAMPSNIRERFKNDPQELINFLKDEKNKKEAVELGLIDAPVVKETPQSLITPQLTSTTTDSVKT